MKKSTLKTLIWLRALAAMAAAAAAAGAALAADPGITEGEILIGNNITLQGGRNAYGAAALSGMKTYFDALNASGGVNGRKIVMRTVDDDNSSANAEANARKLVQQGVFLLFGPIEGGPSAAVAKVASELKVPLFGPMAGPPTLRRPHQPMVFPVRAEHREEFRALMAWGKSTGLKTVGFVHADSDGGRTHVENVKAIAQDLGMSVVLPLPAKGSPTDADLDAMVRAIVSANPQMMLNHGSPSVYEALIAKATQAGSRTVFMGVNSGSSQIASGLGPRAKGMIFAQVVPNPWERKREIAREYQDATRKFDPNAEFSYGALEGYMTAKALAVALRAAGRDLSRAGLIRTLESSSFELGGVKIRYAPGDHEGSRFVDLSLVTRDGRFIH